MEFDFTKEEERLIAEIRSFMKQEVTPEVQAETLKSVGICGGPEGRKFIKKFGAKGWLAANYPPAYGGLGASEMIAYLIRDEMAYAGAPHNLVGAYMAGPTILRIGSEEMKKQFLPPIARGEVEFALGYTEPQAGSDIVALNLRAEQKGDFFILNGQKTFNTHCHVAEYHWLGVRTDFDVPKHKGMSLLIVDLQSPGITIRPMITMGNWRVNEVFYDDVKVPIKNLVAEKNRGFYYLMEALDFERMIPPGYFRRFYEKLIDYIKETTIDGRPLSKESWVRQKVANLANELEIAKLLYFNLAYMLDKKKIPNYQSAMEKLFVSELSQHIANTGMEILGLYGQLKKDSKWAPLDGLIEHLYRWTVVETIYAGTSEIMRNIIAQRGLGLPRG